MTYPRSAGRRHCRSRRAPFPEKEFETMTKLLCAITFSLVSFTCSAETVFKCVDSQGRVTFTARANCPSQSMLDDVVSAHNARPSGAGEGTLMAPVREPANLAPRQAASAAAPAQSAGNRSGCSTGLSDQELRTAKVRGEIVPGMSRKDVEGMRGRVNRDPSARGAGTSTYWNDKYLDVTSVNFDRNGCVRSSYQSGHTP